MASKHSPECVRGLTGPFEQALQKAIYGHWRASLPRWQRSIRSGILLSHDRVDAAAHLADAELSLDTRSTR